MTKNADKIETWEQGGAYIEQQLSIVRNSSKLLSDFTDDEIMEYEERAAIMEYDGGLTKFKAERLAREIIREVL